MNKKITLVMLLASMFFSNAVFALMVKLESEKPVDSLTRISDGATVTCWAVNSGELNRTYMSIRDEDGYSTIRFSRLGASLSQVVESKSDLSEKSFYKRINLNDADTKYVELSVEPIRNDYFLIYSIDPGHKDFVCFSNSKTVVKTEIIDEIGYEMGVTRFIAKPKLNTIESSDLNIIDRTDDSDKSCITFHPGDSENLSLRFGTYNKEYTVRFDVDEIEKPESPELPKDDPMYKLSQIFSESDDDEVDIKGKISLFDFSSQDLVGTSDFNTEDGNNDNMPGVAASLRIDHYNRLLLYFQREEDYNDIDEYILQACIEVLITVIVLQKLPYENREVFFAIFFILLSINLSTY